jgi:regulatory protein
VQLADTLAAKDTPEEVATELLDRLEAAGLVDDAEYAGMLVRTRYAERHQGRRAIAHELRRKGVDEETALGALDQLDEVARKKLRSTRGLDRDVRYRRTIAALGRKGFGGEVSRRALSAALAEEGEAEDADVGTDEFGL